MGRFFEDTIQGRSLNPAGLLLKILLFPLSCLYGLAVSLRNLLYSLAVLKTRKLSVPVISVGNLTAGGTGKTPIALMIADKLLKEGKKPALLARGYGAQEGELNDELRMAQDQLPDLKVYQGSDRYSSGIRAIEEGSDIIILDDGFQHRKLARDCNILTIDSRSINKLKILLPAGPWREGWNSRKRADIAIFTKYTDSINLPETGIEHEFRCTHEPTDLKSTEEFLPLSHIKDKNVFLVCGIGDPEYFRETAEKTGCTVTGKMFFPDHHDYTEKDLDSILAQSSASGAEFILTTEKDLVKLRKLLKKRKNNIEFLALSVRISVLQDTEGFFRSILEQCFTER